LASLVSWAISELHVASCTATQGGVVAGDALLALGFALGILDLGDSKVERDPRLLEHAPFCCGESDLIRLAHGLALRGLAALPGAKREVDLEVLRRAATGGERGRGWLSYIWESRGAGETVADAAFARAMLDRLQQDPPPRSLLEAVMTKRAVEAYERVLADPKRSARFRMCDEAY
jgi:hypothetical protein